MESNYQKPRSIKGNMKLFSDDKMEFTPYGHGEPQMERVKATANGTLMRTTGQKQQSWVARVKVPIEAVDPAADLRDELEKVLKALPESQRKVSPKGRILMQQEWCQVRLNRSKGSVEIGITIDLHEVTNVSQFFTKTAMEINQCLHFNQDSIRQQSIALARNSTK